MKKISNLTSALIVLASFGVTTLGSYAVAAPDPAKIEARKNRKSSAVGEKVGKAIAKAYELYGAEKLNEAIAALQGVESSNEFDMAYLNRFFRQHVGRERREKSHRLLTQSNSA